MAASLVPTENILLSRLHRTETESTDEERNVDYMFFRDKISRFSSYVDLTWCSRDWFDERVVLDFVYFIIMLRLRIKRSDHFVHYLYIIL